MSSVSVQRHWIALGLVIIGLILGYSIPIFQSTDVFAAEQKCNAKRCTGDNCPHKKNCNAEDCAAGTCNCDK